MNSKMQNLELEGYLPEDKSYSTRAIHVAQDPEQWNSRAVATPIVLSSTFKLDSTADLSKSKGYVYTRFGNPTRDVLEKSLAALDNGKYGLTYASGMGAVMAVSSLLKAGEHIACATDVYGGTHKYFNTEATERGLEVSFFDISVAGSMEAAFKPNTRILWIETPSNPLNKIVDLRQAVKVARSRKDIILVVDNTFLSSYFQKPLDFGVDVVMYSLTKYMNGHADVIMGALVTNDDKIYERLRRQQIYLGICPSPFDCYLVSRSLKTLAVRMQAHMKNALQVAKFLQTHPRVEKVVYPGLPDHPQHSLLKSQASGCGGMMCIYIKDAKIEQTVKFLNSLKLFINAGSLGGVESLISAPALVSHFAVAKEERIKIGILDNLVRISVGIENADDIIKDLDSALNQAFK